MPISKLIVVPYELAWGSQIYAIVSATNVKGESLYSPEGNGAVILTNPEAPTDLENVPSVTAKS